MWNRFKRHSILLQPTDRSLSQLKFLNAVDASNADLPVPDFYFSAGYGLAVEESDQHPWELACWDDGAIVFPFLKRSVEGSTSFDIVSPYGYAGTWGDESVPLSVWQTFRRQLKSELIEQGCVAEFQRVGSLVNGVNMLAQSDDQLTVSQHNHTICIDLSEDYESCWNRAESRCRTKTRKARKNNYTWTCRLATGEDAERDSVFRTLYQSTMERVEASEYYLFNDGYFQKLIQGLRGQIYILEVINGDGTVVVSGLFVDSSPLLHLHLLGSDRNSLRDGAGNLAYDGLIQWGCGQQRFSKLHVGGGMVEDDSMYKFKKSFGGEPTPFHTASCILNPSDYNQLCEERASSFGVSLSLLQQSFFPLYRSRPAGTFVEPA